MAKELRLPLSTLQVAATRSQLGAPARQAGAKWFAELWNSFGIKPSSPAAHPLFARVENLGAFLGVDIWLAVDHRHRRVRSDFRSTPRRAGLGVQKKSVPPRTSFMLRVTFVDM